MSEEDHGLEKYVSMFSHRIKEFRGKKPKEEFTAGKALERFKLLSAAGQEGQEPKATFGKGSVLVLSDQERFPPGTILRETYERDGDLHYGWYCLGDFNKEIGALTLFESAPWHDGDNTSPVYILYEQISPERHSTFVEHKIMAKDKKAIELTVSSGTTIHDETEFMQRILRRGENFADNATKIDIITFGKKIKEEVKEKSSVGLKQLVPQQNPIIT